MHILSRLTSDLLVKGSIGIPCFLPFEVEEPSEFELSFLVNVFDKFFEE